MTCSSLYRRMLLAAGSAILSMNIGCSTIADIGEGICHEVEVYASRLEHSHDIEYELLDGTTHTIEVAGHNHHYQSKRMAPVLAVLKPEMVRPIERVLYWKKSEYRDPKMIGDAHSVFNEANICLKENWAPKDLAHESAHLFMRLLDSDIKEGYAKIGEEKYDQNLGEADLGLLSTNWAENPQQVEKGPLHGFISAYGSNTPSECFAEIMEYLFVLAHPSLKSKNSPDYFKILANAVGTKNEKHHHLEDHDARIEYLRRIGALTDKMYESYRTKVHPKKEEYALVR